VCLYQGGTGSGTGMLADNGNENPGALTVPYAGIVDPGTVYTVYVAFRTASNQEGVSISLDGLDYGNHNVNDIGANMDGDLND
jgi:hypothetical protein